MKSPLEVLKDHFVGKTIGEGGPLHAYKGQKIVDVQVESYEPMLDFIITDGEQTETITVLFDWNINLC